MRTVFVVVFALAVMLGLSAVIAAPGEAQSSVGPAEMAAGQEVAYTCPMHPMVRASWPAACPRCSARLVRPDSAQRAVAGCGCPWCGAHALAPAPAEEKGPAAVERGGHGPVAGSDGHCAHCYAVAAQAWMLPGTSFPPVWNGELGLTQDQLSRLEEIRRQAEGSSATVLTEEQRKRVREFREAGCWYCSGAGHGGTTGRSAQQMNPQPRARTRMRGCCW